MPATSKYSLPLKIIALILISRVLFLLYAYQPKNVTYPEDIADKWVCVTDDLTFVICTKLDDIYRTPITDSYIIWNNSYTKVDVYFSVRSFDVYEAPQKGKPLETVLFSGGWKLKDNQLILNIRHDEFFDGRFGKLVFEGTDI